MINRHHLKSSIDRRRFSVTHWSTSPKFLAALRQTGIPKDMSLSSLCHVGSAGSPLSAELHRWFASVFPKGVGLFSGSGGTDLVGGSELMFCTERICSI